MRHCPLPAPLRAARVSGAARTPWPLSLVALSGVLRPAVRIDTNASGPPSLLNWSSPGGLGRRILTSCSCSWWSFCRDASCRRAWRDASPRSATVESVLVELLAELPRASRPSPTLPLQPIVFSLVSFLLCRFDSPCNPSIRRKPKKTHHPAKGRFSGPRSEEEIVIGAWRNAEATMRRATLGRACAKAQCRQPPLRRRSR